MLSNNSPSLAARPAANAVTSGPGRRVPRRIQELRNRVRMARRELTQVPGAPEPTRADIAAHTGLSENEVRADAGVQRLLLRGEDVDFMPRAAAVTPGPAADGGTPVAVKWHRA
ncbi:hypothetical protein ACF1FE_36655, partial [Streptomyces griseofuscus]